MCFYYFITLLLCVLLLYDCYMCASRLPALSAHPHHPQLEPGSDKAAIIVDHGFDCKLLIRRTNFIIRTHDLETCSPLAEP